MRDKASNIPKLKVTSQYPANRQLPKLWSLILSSRPITFCFCCCNLVWQVLGENKSNVDRDRASLGTLDSDRSRFGFNPNKMGEPLRRQTLPAEFSESFEIPPQGGPKIARTPVKVAHRSPSLDRLCAPLACTLARSPSSGQTRQSLSGDLASNKTPASVKSPVSTKSPSSTRSPASARPPRSPASVRLCGSGPIQASEKSPSSVNSPAVVSPAPIPIAPAFPPHHPLIPV